MDRLLRFHTYDLCEQAASRPAFPDHRARHHRLHLLARLRGAGLCLRRGAVRRQGGGRLQQALSGRPGVRGRLIARFAPNTKIRVRSLDDLKKMEDSVDLVVMNSVAQYMTPGELDSAFAVIRRLLKPNGRLVLGDILRPEVGMARDVLALLKFARTHGFLKDALYGLASTALSDYRQLRTRVGLQRYSENEMIEKLARAGFSTSRAHQNI